MSSIDTADQLKAEESPAGVCGACRYAMLYAEQPLCSCPLGVRAPADHPLSLTQPSCGLFVRREGRDLTLHRWTVPTGRPRRNGLHTCGGCRYAMVHAIAPHCDCSLAIPGGPRRLSLFQAACAGFQERTERDLSLHVFSPIQVQEAERPLETVVAR